MREVTKKEWENVAYKALGKDWKFKISSPENNQILGKWWTYISPSNEKEMPLTKNFFFNPITCQIELPKSFEELKQKVEKFENIEPFGCKCKNKQEFIMLYIEKSLEIGRLPGIDGPFDWHPPKIDPRFKDLFEKLHEINRNKSICLSGGIGNAIQRVAKVANIVKETLGKELSGENWAGWKLPNLTEWEKAWIILMLEETKNIIKT